MSWLLLVFGIACNAAASVLIKVAVSAPRRPLSLEHWHDALFNLPLWLGLTSYGCAFVLYAVALARFPMNLVHPVLTTGSVAAVALASSLILGEAMSGRTIAGISLVIVGALLIVWRTT
jgi:small multidrug resistance pump